MRALILLLALCAVLGSSGRAARQRKARERERRDKEEVSRFVVHMEGMTRTQLVASLSNGMSELEVERAVGPPGWFVVKAPHSTHPHLDNLRGRSDIAHLSPLKELIRKTRLEDPSLIDAWYLTGLSHFGNPVAITNNASYVWDTYDGRGVTVAIVDDGVYTNHDDLQDAVKSSVSTSLCGSSWLPPTSSYTHGTRAAAVAVARRGNGICGVGVAPGATLAAIRLLSCRMDDASEATALSYKCDGTGSDQIQIYSSSWGPPDDGDRHEAPGMALSHAIDYCSTHGRNGKGSIYIFAGGNGAEQYDNLAWDGYANHVNSIPVGAIATDGIASYYSERGAGLMVSVGSDGGPNRPYSQIATSTYSTRNNAACGWFGGTSAAAPQVAGIAALLLQKRADLTQRDVMNIFVHAATMVDPRNPEDSWVENKAGLWHSNAYGFGLLTAPRVLQVAETWQLVGPSKKYCTQTLNAHHHKIERNTYLQFAAAFTSTMTKVEKVYVTLDIDFDGSLSDLGRIILTSPHDTPSVLVTVNRQGDKSLNWAFGSVRFWGENPNGSWKILVENVGRKPFYINSAMFCGYGE